MTWPVTRDLREAMRDLFPGRRDRLIVLGLVALAAAVSVTELAATQLFSVLILPEEKLGGARMGALVALFLVFFGGLRVVNFLREVYRLKVFERTLDSGLNRATDSWRWAMAMEITSILSTAARIAVVAAACVILAPWFGAAVVGTVALVGQAVSVIYRRQRGHQREFRSAQLAHAHVDNALKVRTRVLAGETGSLLAYVGIVALMSLLIWMVYVESIEPGTGFVLFIALRMLGQTLTELSKGLMRFVRAKAFSEVPTSIAADDA